MTKATVLLTGATGFIGSHLLRDLTSAGKVITLGRRPAAGTAHISFDLAGDSIAPESDISQVPAGAVLVHAAAATRRSQSDDSDASRYRNINVDGTRKLLTALEARLPSYILYVSTTDVYAPSLAPISESSPVGPTTQYATSKLEAEELVLAFGREKRIPVGVARFGSIYGPGEEAFGKLIPTAIRAAISREPISVIGEGVALRDFLFVDDTVRAVRKMLARKATGIYNVLSGNTVSVMQVVAAINSLTRNPAGIRFVDRSAAESDRVFAPSNLLAFNWAPQTLLRVGLKREIAASLKQRPVVAIDLDGTLLNHWTRMYRPYRDYLVARQIVPLTLAAYKGQKRAGKSEAAIATAALEEPGVAGYLAWKREHIEEWALLCTDTLNDQSLTLLGSLNRRFRVVLVTSRHNPRLLKRQLQRLSIQEQFFRVIAVGGEDRPSAKAEVLEALQQESEKPIWYIADSEEDIWAARRAGVRVAVVSWGLRGAAFLRKLKPDRLVVRADAAVGD
jgi:nucleoside-diphosphate-sugar epimerase/phosphoglycolate phosphatase-like HAD superfamily hydrolase